MTTITLICKKDFKSQPSQEQLKTIIESLSDDPIGQHLTDVHVTMNDGTQLHYFKSFPKRKRR